MATYFDTAALDAMLSSIKTGATTGQVLLITTYTEGDPYGTVDSNKIGNAAITNADFTGPGAGTGNARTMSFDGKTGTATGTVGAGQDLHIAITNGTDTVLAVTKETTEQAISSGNTLNFPSFNLTANQPPD